MIAITVRHSSLLCPFELQMPGKNIPDNYKLSLVCLTPVVPCTVVTEQLQIFLLNQGFDHSV